MLEMCLYFVNVSLMKLNEVTLIYISGLLLLSTFNMFCCNCFIIIVHVPCHNCYFCYGFAMVLLWLVSNSQVCELFNYIKGSGYILYIYNIYIALICSSPTHLK